MRPNEHGVKIVRRGASNNFSSIGIVLKPLLLRTQLDVLC